MNAQAIVTMILGSIVVFVFFKFFSKEKEDPYVKSREEMKIWYTQICDVGVNVILDYIEKNITDSNKSIIFLREQWDISEEFILHSLGYDARAFMQVFIRSLLHEFEDDEVLVGQINFFRENIEKIWKIFDLVPKNNNEMIVFDSYFVGSKRDMAEALRPFCFDFFLD